MEIDFVILSGVNLLAGLFDTVMPFFDPFRTLNQKPFPGAILDIMHPMVPHIAGAWWINEGAGSTVCDSGAYGNHGTLVGGARHNYGGIELDGITGYVTVPHKEILMPADGITVIVRTRNLAVPALYDTILMKTTDAGWGDGYGFYYTGSNTVGFFAQNYARVATIMLSPQQDNTLVGTYDGNRVRIFANGIEGASFATTGIITPNTAPLELGRGRDNAYNINGILIWIQILNLALDRDSARQLSSFQ